MPWTNCTNYALDNEGPFRWGMASEAGMCGTGGSTICMPNWTEFWAGKGIYTRGGWTRTILLRHVRLQRLGPANCVSHLAPGGHIYTR